MKDTRFDNKLSGVSLAFQPLYMQVADYIKQLIVERRWLPGDMLPSEFKLAEEFNVSQGTVRKALNDLTDAKIVNRRQGVGTFVSEHTAQDALYRFFPLQQDGQPPELPKAELISKCHCEYDPRVFNALGLSAEDKVIKLKRRRILQDQYCLTEEVYLPESLFPGLLERDDIPHTLYHFYQTDFNQTVQKTMDSIKAVIADQEDAKLLEIKGGEPMLEVSRVTHSIQQKVIEYRISRCRTDAYHYLVELD
jgi:GntR family transcriptional regulator